MFKNADYIMSNGILIGCHQGLKKRYSIYSFNIKSVYIKK